MLFVLRSNVDDNRVNPLSDQTLNALQSQFQEAVPVLQDSKDFLVIYSQLKKKKKRNEMNEKEIWNEQIPSHACIWTGD